MKSALQCSAPASLTRCLVRVALDLVRPASITGDQCSRGSFAMIEIRLVAYSLMAQITIVSSKRKLTEFTSEGSAFGVCVRRLAVRLLKIQPILCPKDIRIL